jgi:putative transposase
MNMSYPSDVTDSQWQVIKEFVDTGRKRKHDLRSVLNGIFYVVKGGIHWRMLPHDFPQWQVVYYYFTCWKHAGVIEKVQVALVNQVRQKQGKAEQPTAGIVDAQSIKSTLVCPRSVTGFDGGKLVKGIKRHIVVDTLGLLLAVVVHSAGIAERKGGAMVVNKLKQSWTQMKKIFADGGYSLVGKAAQTLQTLGGYVLEIVRRTDLSTFQVLPKRWIVERTFAWIDTNRRNAKFYERKTCTAEAMTQLAAIRMMLNRLCPRADKPRFKKKKPVNI